MFLKISHWKHMEKRYVNALHNLSHYVKKQLSFEEPHEKEHTRGNLVCPNFI